MGWGGPRWEMSSTLGGQHGTRCLLEVQELLQEEDGLRGEKAGPSRSRAGPKGWISPHGASPLTVPGQVRAGGCLVKRVSASFLLHPVGLASGETPCLQGHAAPPSPPAIRTPGAPGSTYVARELVHGAVLGHVVFLVWVVLWERQPESLKQRLSRPQPVGPQRHLLADRCQDTPTGTKANKTDLQELDASGGASGAPGKETEARGPPGKEREARGY